MRDVFAADVDDVFVCVCFHAPSLNSSHPIVINLEKFKLI